MKTDKFKRYAVVVSDTDNIAERIGKHGIAHKLIFSDFNAALKYADKLSRTYGKSYSVKILDKAEILDKWLEERYNEIIDTAYLEDINKVFSEWEELLNPIVKEQSNSRYVRTEGLGVFRTEDKGEGKYKYRYLYYDNGTNKYIRVSKKKHLEIQKSGPDSYNKKRYCFIHTEKMRIANKMQKLYYISVDTYFKDKDCKCISQYSSKFYMMIDYETWLKYPVFDSKLINYRT